MIDKLKKNWKKVLALVLIAVGGILAGTNKDIGSVLGKLFIDIKVIATTTSAPNDQAN